MINNKPSIQQMYLLHHLVVFFLTFLFQSLALLFISSDVQPPFFRGFHVSSARSCVLVHSVTETQGESERKHTTHNSTHNNIDFTLCQQKITCKSKVHYLVGEIAYIYGTKEIYTLNLLM